MTPAVWKGKGKARAVSMERRDDGTEGDGGADGVVLPLSMVGSGIFDAVYTLPVQVGQNGPTFSLQVDTGSSDLWLASASCSSQACAQTGGHLYKPSGATQTGLQFSIHYLQGDVSGPVVWDRVQIGGYVVDTQALAAADTITNEPLTPQFTGLLGLALPLNSVIAELIPPVTTNTPDGAAWASNLFSITPSSQSPAAHFLSLALSRPGSDRVPAVLGIGRHPQALVPDPSLIQYSSLVAERKGSLFWNVGVRAITVYVNGMPMPVALGRSNMGTAVPSAVLDSGVPLILMTRTLANAVYGALGIGPGSDGQYYVPCSTPLNMTITLDDRPEIPLHPLDLTGEPPQDNQATNCIGLIQAADQLAEANSGIGDMILGVPFLRNTYTVMAYAVPDKDGSFPTTNNNNTNEDPEQGDAAGELIKPRLGLLSLTNPQTALDEFHTVRVLNQPLSPSGSASANNNSNGSTTFAGGEKKLSVGIIVLIGLLSFFVLCFTLFGIRWFLLRRKLRTANAAAGGAAAFSGDDKRDLGAYRLASRRASMEDDGLPSEDAFRRMRYEEYLTREKPLSRWLGAEKGIAVGEFGVMERGTGDDTLVGSGRDMDKKALPPVVDMQAVGAEDEEDAESSPERAYHQRTLTEIDVAHGRNLSVTLPLLPGQLFSPPGDVDEFGVTSSMAGVGTAGRTRKIDPLRDSVSSTSSAGAGAISPLIPVVSEQTSSAALRHPTPPAPVARGRPQRTPSGPRSSVASRMSASSSESQHSNSHSAR